MYCFGEEGKKLLAQQNTVKLTTKITLQNESGFLTKTYENNYI